MSDEPRAGYVKPDGHVHGWHDPNCVPVGPTVCLSPTSHGGAAHITNPDGTMAGGEVEHLAGFIFSHDRAGGNDTREAPLRTMLDGSPCWCVSADEPHDGWIHSPVCESLRSFDPRARCEGAVNVDPHFDRPCWGMTGTLEGGDLTLSPSILCGDGFHGYVQGGVWVPA